MPVCLRALVFLVLVGGCASGSGKAALDSGAVGGEAGTAADDSDGGLDGGADDSGAGDAGDGDSGDGEAGDGDPVDEASVADWAGDWDGVFDLFGELPVGPGGGPPPRLGCEGELDVLIDEAGIVEGGGSCVAEPFGEVPVLLSGGVDAAGRFSGALVIDARAEVFEAAAGAEADDPAHLHGTLDGEVELRGGPAAGATVELSGTLDLER